MDMIETKQFFEGDRRLFERVESHRPCKVFDPQSGKYIAGETCDISEGGLMIVCDRPLMAAPGDTVYVGVAMTRRQALISATEMREAEVIRVLRDSEGRSAVALRFLDVALPISSRLAA